MDHLRIPPSAAQYLHAKNASTQMSKPTKIEIMVWILLALGVVMLMRI